MSLASYYPQIKMAHIALVATSGSFFAARGVGVLAGAAWPMVAWARRGSAFIDTLLLTAGASLWVALQLDPVRNTWLGLKMLALVAYIVLGSFALKRARTRRHRAICFALALTMFSAMLLLALTHRPLLT